MNNGPNVMSLLIIGGVAGASIFGLYVGYRALFEKLENNEDLSTEEKKKIKKGLDEILSSLPETKFDVVKTLKSYKEKEKKEEKEVKEVKEVTKSVEKKDIELKKIEKQDKIENLDKISTKDLKENIDKKRPLAPKNSDKKLVDKVEEKEGINELPKVMSLKKIDEDEEVVETLMEIPTDNKDAKHANSLMLNESIRTIDRTNLKKKKKRSRKIKNKKV